MKKLLLTLFVLVFLSSFRLNAYEKGSFMNWDRFKNYYLALDNLGFSIDISRMNFSDDFFNKMEGQVKEAHQSMEELESGAIANPDEHRMVGHYWLRHPELAPSEEITKEIKSNLEHVEAFTKKIHEGTIKGSSGPFKNLIVIGIGGSALGPQFVSQALGNVAKDKLKPYFFDNTDPDGMDVVLSQLKGQLGQTLVLVISKSGGTPETRNGMIEAEHAYKDAGIDFSKHAVAITGANSKLDNYAKDHGWLDSFPLWDWVGGRTSELASVGLLPASLQGFDILQMLHGAQDMDVATRTSEATQNPALLLALMWYYVTDGKGAKDMVILPYKERLSLFSKYLQQLIMESLGKEKDLQGNVVHQGIAVYGNKGSTDQHAYVQQLREGVNNFFVTFIEVLKDRDSKHVEVEPLTTSGDYLQAFLLGTRDALSENKRESITITIDEVSPRSIGALIALYERAVGYYASFININAYHQPGVEAGKKAAASTLSMKSQITDYLHQNPNQNFTAESLAKSIQQPEKVELTFKLLEHMAANPEKKVTKVHHEPFSQSTYAFNP